MSEIQIRPFEKTDTEQILQRIKELQTHERAIEPRMKHPDDVGKWYLDMLVKGCTDYKGRIFIAAEAENIVGYACVFSEIICQEIDETDYLYAFITDVAVAPAQRGKGLGRRLIDACREHAAKHDAKCLRIGVLAENGGALGLYRNMGFKPHSMELEMSL